MDFLREEKMDLDAELSDKNDPIVASCFDKTDMNKSQKMGLKLANDHMSQNICMFRKYLLFKTQNTEAKTNIEESEVNKTRCPLPLVSATFGSNMQRQASFLEQALLPGIRIGAIQATGDGKNSASQLTIFYAGAINVYDNVPVDKARAIMQFAGESSLSKPAPVELPKTDMKKQICQSNLTSVCKLQEDLPIARKISLQHFLEKRRRRIITRKSPYSLPSTEHKESKSTKDDGINGDDHTISLSPFPSRLGYFSPVLANKGR